MAHLFCIEKWAPVSFGRQQFYDSDSFKQKSVMRLDLSSTSMY